MQSFRMMTIVDQAFGSGKFINFGLLFVFVLLIATANLNCAGFTIGAQEKKAKKPRFHLTERTLRDGKTKLEWVAQQDGSPVSLSWYKTIEYVTSLNRRRYAGFRDWRVPTREELLSLVEYAKDAGFVGNAGHEVCVALQKIGLAQIREEHLWSSTVDLYNERLAWAVDMRTGMPERIEKHLYENVIAVRMIK